MLMYLTQIIEFHIGDNSTRKITMATECSNISNRGNAGEVGQEKNPEKSKLPRREQSIASRMSVMFLKERVDVEATSPVNRGHGCAPPGVASLSPHHPSRRPPHIPWAAASQVNDSQTWSPALRQRSWIATFFQLASTSWRRFTPTCYLSAPLLQLNPTCSPLCHLPLLLDTFTPSILGIFDSLHTPQQPIPHPALPSCFQCPSYFRPSSWPCAYFLIS